MLSRLQGHSATERIMVMKNSNETIGNRTRELPACNAVPQPTAPPHAPPLNSFGPGQGWRNILGARANIADDFGRHSFACGHLSSLAPSYGVFQWRFSAPGSCPDGPLMSPALSVRDEALKSKTDNAEALLGQSCRTLQKAVMLSREQWRNGDL
jgi:hypothetical protein